MSCLETPTSITLMTCIYEMFCATFFACLYLDIGMFYKPDVEISAILNSDLDYTFIAKFQSTPSLKKNEFFDFWPTLFLVSENKINTKFVISDFDYPFHQFSDQFIQVLKNSIILTFGPIKSGCSVIFIRGPFLWAILNDFWRGPF